MQPILNVTHSRSHQTKRNTAQHLVEHQNGRRAGVQLEQFENFWVKSRPVPNVGHVDDDKHYTQHNDYKLHNTGDN